MPTEYEGTPSAPVVRGVTAPATTPMTPANTEVGDLIIAFAASAVLFEGEEFEADGWESLFSGNEFLFGDLIHVACRVATEAGAAPMTPYTDFVGTLTGLIVLERGTFDPDIALHPVVAADDSDDPPDPPALTTSCENCLVIAVGYWDNGEGFPADITVTPPTGYTEAWEIAGSNRYELSAAYKVAETPGAEDPDAFGDGGATPSGTASLTLEVRPNGWVDEVEIPENGENREESVMAPPWQQCARRERYVLDRMPVTQSVVVSGTPLVTLPVNTPYNSETVDGNVLFENCVVGDKILVDVSMTYELTGTWPDTYAAPYWDVRIEAVDDADGEADDYQLDGGRWFGPEFELIPWINVRRHVRFVGVHQVTLPGTTKIDTFFFIGDGGSGNAMVIHKLAINAIRFPTAWAPATPVLTRTDFDLADTLGGDVITAYGSSLGGATITYGGTSCTVLETGRDYIQFIVPAKAAGMHALQATTSYGASNTDVEVESWSPEDIVGVTAFGEVPDYESPGVGASFLNNGIWHMRVGTDWEWESDGSIGAPNVAPGGTPGFGTPTWGSGLPMMLEGPAANTLFDLSAPSKGSYGACVDGTAGESLTTHLFSGDPHEFFHATLQATGFYTLQIGHEGAGAVSTGWGGVWHLFDVHSILARFEDGAGGTGVFETQINGFPGFNEPVTEEDVDTFYEGASGGWSTVDSNTEPIVMGTDGPTRTAIAGPIAIKAFFFANTKVSDSDAVKWRKWCQVRHGARVFTGEEEW